MRFYNSEQPYQGLEYRTPAQVFEDAWGHDLQAETSVNLQPAPAQQRNGVLDCSLTVPDPVQQMGSASTSKSAVTRTTSDEPLAVLEVEVTHCAYIAIGNTENAIPERIKGYGQDTLMTMLADSGASPPAYRSSLQWAWTFPFANATSMILLAFAESLRFGP